jgi:hypothetical protein
MVVVRVGGNGDDLRDTRETRSEKKREKGEGGYEKWREVGGK